MNKQATEKLGESAAEPTAPERSDSEMLKWLMERTGYTRKVILAKMAEEKARK